MYTEINTDKASIVSFLLTFLRKKKNPLPKKSKQKSKQTNKNVAHQSEV